jgi:hypothetical protein
VPDLVWPNEKYFMLPVEVPDEFVVTDVPVRAS